MPSSVFFSYLSGDPHLFVFVHKFCFIVGLCRSSDYSHAGILANNFFPPFQDTSASLNNNNTDDVNVPFLSFFIFSPIVFRRLLVPFDEPVTFTNLALLITFTLSLVQALLSLIGAVISCLWSPCCFTSPAVYRPVTAPAHYSPTTPHRYEVTPGDSPSFLYSLRFRLESIALHSSHDQTNTPAR